MKRKTRKMENELIIQLRKIRSNRAYIKKKEKKKNKGCKQ